MAEKRTILFVDDEERLRQIYGQYFEAVGYDALYAGDGCAAVNMVRDHTVDLVVMDINMPHVDGELGVEIIREIEPAMPIIIVSGHIPRHMEEKGLPGVHAIVRKPFNFDELKSVVESALE